MAHPLFTGHNPLRGEAHFFLCTYFWGTRHTLLPIPPFHFSPAIPYTCVLSCLPCILAQDAKSLGLVTAIQSIWETKGIAGFYAGVITRGLWAAGTVAMQFLIYDSVKALLFAALMLGIA